MAKEGSSSEFPTRAHSKLTVDYDEFGRNGDQREAPELRLLKAILSRAIFDVLAIAKDIKQIHKLQAQAYILSQAIDPWSFIWVCHQLDLDPGRVRATVASLSASNSVIRCNEATAITLLKHI